MTFRNLMSSLICPMAGYKLGCLCVPRNLGAPGQSQGSYLSSYDSQSESPGTLEICPVIWRCPGHLGNPSNQS